VDVASDETDLILVDGFFEIDTNAVDGFAVSDWSLDVTVVGDPNFNITNSIGTFGAGATSSTITFDAFTATSVCDGGGTCIQSLRFDTTPITATGGTIALVSPVSVCVSFVAVAPSNCTIITNNTMTSVQLMGTVVSAVPEPSGIALFGIGMLAVYPLVRGRHPRKG